MNKSKTVRTIVTAILLVLAVLAGLWLGNGAMAFNSPIPTPIPTPTPTPVPVFHLWLPVIYG